MAGSGTVLRNAVLLGHDTIGYDIDPLAVIISTACTHNVKWNRLDSLFNSLLSVAGNLKDGQIHLPWIDNDEATAKYVKYWFGLRQRKVLRKLAFALRQLAPKCGATRNELAVLKLVFSKLIITKVKGASLAWDVSHSRPHKVRSTNTFDVWTEIRRAYNDLKACLKEIKSSGKAKVYLGDARSMNHLKEQTVDMVVTSPPYLNAIDYLRGHRLSLVWFGYSVRDLRDIRGGSVGAERSLTSQMASDYGEYVLGAMPTLYGLPNSEFQMVLRYIDDAFAVIQEVTRILKRTGKAVFVIGDSCLKGVFIENSSIFRHAAEYFGLRVGKLRRRTLPITSRYLPLPCNKSNPLGKRMRDEVIMEFSYGTN